jgi:transposase-like protein
MGPRRDNHSKVKRKITRIAIEAKKEIIAKYENGVRVSDLATLFGVAKSTICTILKNKKAINGDSVARGMTVITKQRSETIEVVENCC